MMKLSRSIAVLVVAAVGLFGAFALAAPARAETGPMDTTPPQAVTFEETSPPGPDVIVDPVPDPKPEVCSVFEWVDENGKAHADRSGNCPKNPCEPKKWVDEKGHEHVEWPRDCKKKPCDTGKCPPPPPRPCEGKCKKIPVYNPKYTG